MLGLKWTQKMWTLPRLHIPLFDTCVSLEAYSILQMLNLLLRLGHSAARPVFLDLLKLTKCSKIVMGAKKFLKKGPDPNISFPAPLMLPGLLCSSSSTP
eukprot:g33414.t1